MNDEGNILERETKIQRVDILLKFSGYAVIAVPVHLTWTLLHSVYSVRGQKMNSLTTGWSVISSPFSAPSSFVIRRRSTSSLDGRSAS